MAKATITFTDKGDTIDLEILLDPPAKKGFEPSFAQLCALWLATELVANVNKPAAKVVKKHFLDGKKKPNAHQTRKQKTLPG